MNELDPSRLPVCSEDRPPRHPPSDLPPSLAQAPTVAVEVTQESPVLLSVMSFSHSF